ncbi:MAG: signal recognition particle protein [Chloroflexi bacterium]|nr:signal recognition particle protein [Chloroflexota bacterium]
MFEILSEKLQRIFDKLGNKGRLTERDVDEALREVRLALLEADVNFQVARGFVASVREKAIGREVLESLTPAQQVIKIVHRELISLLAEGQPRLDTAPHPPTIIMLVGLQGSGKTTTVAKLAQSLKRQGQRPLMVAADVRRPAAVEQLVALGSQLSIPVYQEGTQTSAKTICGHALEQARKTAASHVLVDTGGRLHIDAELMDELVQLRGVLNPTETLLVADAMMGQDAVKAATEFHAAVPLTGVILTKIDGDARGGAALSIRFVTGVPVKFLGIGEKLDALEPFHPDRLASRILGMGDVLTLVEKVEQTVEKEQAKAWEKKLRQASFDLEDFREQLQQLRKMGPLEQLLEMVPGFSTLKRQMPVEAMDERQMKKVEAIILSMTPQERHYPHIIDGSRRRRIARGSGTGPQDVNRLLNQFRDMQKLMRQMSNRRGGLLSRMW